MIAPLFLAPCTPATSPVIVSFAPSPPTLDLEPDLLLDVALSSGNHPRRGVKYGVTLVSRLLNERQR